jgi:hypothetical protein
MSCALKKKELVSELMFYVRTYKLSEILQALATQCREDRLGLSLKSPVSYVLVVYFSDQENVLLAAIGMIEQSEKKAMNEEM